MERLKLILLVGGDDLPEKCASFFYAHCQKIRNGTRLVVVMATKKDIQKGWDGIFSKADVIMDYGNCPLSVYSQPFPKKIPVVTWSGDDKESLDRIMKYV